MSHALHRLRSAAVPAQSPALGAARVGRGRAGVLRKAAAALTTTLLVAAVAAFVLLAIGPRVLGYQTSTMLTGSMSPLINPGDVVITQPVPVTGIKVGDIITYHIPVEDQRVETHRVTEIITNPDGSVSMQTKGDANNGTDPWLATFQEDTVDKHVATIPYLGNVIRAVRTPIVLNVLLYGAPAILVLGMLATIWSRKPETDGAAAPSTTKTAARRA